MMVTMTALYERTQARAVDFDLKKALLIILAMPFFLLGALAQVGWKVLQAVVGWGYSAAVVGWEFAKNPKSDDG